MLKFQGHSLRKLNFQFHSSLFRVLNFNQLFRVKSLAEKSTVAVN